MVEDRKEFGYVLFLEVEFTFEIENYYENVNKEKVAFNINELVQKMVSVNYKNITSIDMSH